MRAPLFGRQCSRSCFSSTCARKSHRRNMWGSLSPCCKVSRCFSMLHNNFMKRDPCCVVLFGLCLIICELYAADSRMCILRTMFFCIQGRPMEVLPYCMSSLDTCLTPAHVHTLFVSYPPLKLQPTGTFSNCFFSAPFLASLREHRTTFESILDVTSPILAFSYPQSISGGRGTGPCSPASMMPKNTKTRRSGRFGLPNWEM